MTSASARVRAAGSALLGSPSPKAKEKSASGKDIGGGRYHGS